LADTETSFCLEEDGEVIRRSPALTASPAGADASAVLPAPTRDASDGGSRGGDVSLCVRLRPGLEEPCASAEDGAVRLRAETGEKFFRCDHAFGPGASQEDVFTAAVVPICQAVLRGYNGAVIAYGQTGSGKTHTMIGDLRAAKGVAPLAVTTIFTGLSKRRAWCVEVSVLEIYNERARDLLATGPGAHVVDVHEVRLDDHVGVSFRCPDAVTWPCRRPEDALEALSEGMKRRETARTDMNHHSSRSHLIFTLCTCQSDREVGATLRGRLHLVDLAGSERLKRSMASESPAQSLTPQRGGGGGAGSTTPRRSSPAPAPGTPRSGGALRNARGQRREACDINKSLSQLALVIQRLTTASGGMQYVPYRDSVLTRLLADSFGGSSKTCLIICCSAMAQDREETRCSLEFGRRAKLVRNRAEINLEVQNEPSPVLKALIAKTIARLQCESSEMRCEHDAILREQARFEKGEAHAQQKCREAEAVTLALRNQTAAEMCQIKEEMGHLRRGWAETEVEVARIQAETAAGVAEHQAEREALRGELEDSASELSHLAQQRAADVTSLGHEVAELRCRCRTEEAAACEVQEARASEVSRLLLEQGQLQTAALVAQSKTLQVKEEWMGVGASLREEQAVLQARWRQDVERVREEGAAMAKSLEDELVVLKRQWQEAIDEAARLQEQKAALAVQLQQEDALAAQEERASAISALESEKIQLYRRWQNETAGLSEAKSAAVSELQREKCALRRKWQEAVEELRQAQAEHAAANARREEAERETVAALELEQLAMRRQCQDELLAAMEARATLVGKLEAERLVLQRRCDEDVASLAKGEAQAAARAEAEKSALQKRWQEAAGEAARLVEERELASGRGRTEVALLRRSWEDDAAQLRQECAAEVAQLEDRLRATQHGCAEAEAEAAQRCEAHAAARAVLEQQLAKRCWRRFDANDHPRELASASSSDSGGISSAGCTDGHDVAALVALSRDESITSQPGWEAAYSSGGQVRPDACRESLVAGFQADTVELKQKWRSGQLPLELQQAVAAAAAVTAGRLGRRCAGEVLGTPASDGEALAVREVLGDSACERAPPLILADEAGQDSPKAERVEGEVAFHPVSPQFGAWGPCLPSARSQTAGGCSIRAAPGRGAPGGS